MTARAAARKRPGFRPESDSSEPREQDRDNSRRSFCLSPRVVGVNYALTNFSLKRFEDVKALLGKLLPVARRVLGENDDLTLRMRWHSAQSLYMDVDATLEDLREAVTTLEDAEPTARRVLGGAHPHTRGIKNELRITRALRARHERAATAQDRLRTTT